MKNITQQTLLALILLLLNLDGKAQSTANDQKGIESQVEGFFTSWNNHDFGDMRKYISKDCDFVNIVGMHWKGRDDIQYAHQALHEKIFKDVPLAKRSVEIRFVKSDIAIVHVLMHRTKPIITPDGSSPAYDGALATFVFVKTNNIWMVEAVENVVVDESAKPFNPVTLRDK